MLGVVHIIQADLCCVCFGDDTFSETFVRNRKRSKVSLPSFACSTPEKVLENSEWEVLRVPYA